MNDIGRPKPDSTGEAAAPDRAARAPASRSISSAAFAPIPFRAIGDERLKLVHFRVLAATAYHDRLSGPRGKGQGCWAGNDALAKMCGCHITSLSTALTELAEWGYIAREPHPLNKRLRIYRVRYEENDHLPAGKVSERDERGGGAAESDGTLCPEANDCAPIVCPPKRQVSENEQESGVEYIPRKREDIRQKPKTATTSLGPKNESLLLPPDEEALERKLQTASRILDHPLTDERRERWPGDIRRLDEAGLDFNRHVLPAMIETAQQAAKRGERGERPATIRSLWYFKDAAEKNRTLEKNVGPETWDWLVAISVRNFATSQNQKIAAVGDDRT